MSTVPGWATLFYGLSYRYLIFPLIRVYKFESEELYGKIVLNM